MNVHGGHHAFFAALVKRPVLLLTLLFTCVVVGVIAYARIPIQMMPDGIVDPGLQVFVTNPGSSAQENEERVARILEAELRTLAGVEDIESSSRQDNVGIFVNFKSDTDMDFAKAEVRDRIERARPQLPTSVQEIGIYSWSESDLPVMFFALLHPGDSERTDFLVDNVIKRRLESVDGVGKIEVYGLADDSLRIELNEDRVKAANLDIGGLIRRLATDNFALPMGEVEDGGSRVLLRSDMRFKNPEEIEEYPVGNGLVLRDIARVIPVKSVRENLSRVDGKYAYWGEIQKDGQANVVDTCHRLTAALKDLEQDPALRGEFSFRVLFNQGEFIENSLQQLKHTAITGGWLAVLILFLFLWRVRLTLIVALSIPISVLLTIAWAYFTGRTFNVLTMTGMTLALGMLVDNSIVVIENITRLRAEGRPMTESIVSGTAEVGLAVLLSTLTVVVVFLPLIFMGENPSLRIILGELGLPLCVALIVSLFVALIFLPVLVRGALGPRTTRVHLAAGKLAAIGSLPGRCVAWCIGAVRGLFHGFVRVLHAVCARVVAVAARVRYPLAAIVVAIAAWKAWQAWPAIEIARLQTEASGNQATVWMALLFGAPALVAVLLLVLGLRRWATLLAVAPTRPQNLVPASRSVLELLIEGNQHLVRWSVTHRFAAGFVMVLALATGLIPYFRMTMAAFGQEDSKSRLNLYVELEDNFTLAQAAGEMERYDTFLEAHRDAYHFDHYGNRFSVTGGRVSLYWDQPQKQEHMDFVLADIKRNVPRLPGHRLQFFDEMQNGDNKSRSVVTFRLHGPDSDELERYGKQAVDLLHGVPGLSSVSSPLENAPKQVRVKFDSDLAQQLGVSPQAALENISWALRGVQLPRYQEPGREIPLIIEYDDDDVAGLGTLRDLTVYTNQNAVPLSSFSDLEFGQQTRAINRRNGQATFTIQAKVDNPAKQREMSDAGMRALTAGLELPRGYSVGEEDTVGHRQEEEMKELLSALMLGIVLVFLLMGILFESFLLPISVLFTIPYAILGSYWALYLTGTAMDSVGWIGIIILIGVEVNHGIVLIDRIHALRAEGIERTAAILEGCRNRVRPILMTALTAVMGLYPMAVTEPTGEGIDYRALATCVAGGLIVSTVFTLWVVPLAYSLLDDLASAIATRLKWSLRRPGASIGATGGAPVAATISAPATN